VAKEFPYDGGETDRDLKTGETMTTIAYHNNPELKAKAVASMREHRRLDTLQPLATGADGKGCAVWCILGEYAHSKGPAKIGFAPQFLYLIDALFERLAEHGNGREHGDFAIAILEAVPAGADTDLTWRRFCYWLLSAEDSPMYKAAQHPRVKGFIAAAAELYKEWLDTGVCPADDRWEASVPRPLTDSACPTAAGAAWAAARAAARAADTVDVSDVSWMASRAADASRVADAAGVASGEATYAAAYRAMAAKLIEISKQEKKVEI
jgi:hypothetical protein